MKRLMVVLMSVGLVMAISASAMAHPPRGNRYQYRYRPSHPTSRYYVPSYRYSYSLSPYSYGSSYLSPSVTFGLRYPYYNPYSFNPGPSFGYGYGSSFGSSFGYSPYGGGGYYGFGW